MSPTAASAAVLILTVMVEQDGPVGSDEEAQCWAGALDETFAKQLMLSEFDGSEPSAEFTQSVLDIAAECDIPLN